MTHANILDYFKKVLPYKAENISVWYPNGKNSIRVRMTDGRELIFTMTGKYDWTLETLNHFMQSMKMMKGEKKMK